MFFGKSQVAMNDQGNYVIDTVIAEKKGAVLRAVAPGI